MFRDRNDAGRRLAKSLLSYGDRRPVVLALPRGGVPVGFEVARALHAPLDLVLVRKLGAPHWEELAIGALAEGEPPERVLNEDVVHSLRVPPEYLETATETARREIERRRAVWLAGRAPIDVRGRTAIVVDDGIATGATMRAALRATRRRGPDQVVLAVPVAAPHALAELRAEADVCVCLETPVDFEAVGQFYVRFPQLDDEDVTKLLAQSAAFAPAAGH